METPMADQNQPKVENGYKSPVDLTSQAPPAQRLSKNSEPYRPITRPLESFPEGYPHVAAFLSSDRSFQQYRGFSYLHSRVLLSLQYEIEKLESQLESLDEFDKVEPEGDPHKLLCQARDNLQRNPKDIQSEDFHALFRRTRPQVLAELKIKLLEYDEVLLKTKEVATLQDPSQTDWESVRNYFVERKPLVDGEQQFIKKKEDIVILRSGGESTAVDSSIGMILSRMDSFLLSHNCDIIRRIFTTPELRAETCDKRIHYYAPARMEMLVNTIITFVILALMILPVVALQDVSSVSGSVEPFKAIGILIPFTFLFGWAMSGLTRATRQELFAASAAYCAVLGILIGIFSLQALAIGGQAVQVQIVN